MVKCNVKVTLSTIKSVLFLDLCSRGFWGMCKRCPVTFLDYIKWTRSSLRNIVFIADLGSFCYRQNSRAVLLKNVCHIKPIANNFSTTHKFTCVS